MSLGQVKLQVVYLSPFRSTNSVQFKFMTPNIAYSQNSKHYIWKISELSVMSNNVENLRYLAALAMKLYPLKLY